MNSETWKEFFERKLREYNDDWAEDNDLLNALCDIMEEEQ